MKPKYTTGQIVWTKEGNRVKIISSDLYHGENEFYYRIEGLAGQKYESVFESELFSNREQLLEYTVKVMGRALLNSMELMLNLKPLLTNLAAIKPE